MFDPREKAGWSRCPFCGGDIVMGIRKDTRNVSLAHSGHKDPTDPTGTRYVTGCEQFNGMLSRPSVVVDLYNAGARFQTLVPG